MKNGKYYILSFNLNELGQKVYKKQTKEIEVFVKDEDGLCDAADKKIPSDLWHEFSVRKSYRDVKVNDCLVLVDNYEKEYYVEVSTPYNSTERCFCARGINNCVNYYINPYGKVIGDPNLKVLRYFSNNDKDIFELKDVISEIFEYLPIFDENYDSFYEIQDWLTLDNAKQILDMIKKMKNEYETDKKKCV